MDICIKRFRTRSASDQTPLHYLGTPLPSSMSRPTLGGVKVSVVEVRTWRSLRGCNARWRARPRPSGSVGQRSSPPKASTRLPSACTSRRPGTSVNQLIPQLLFSHLSSPAYVLLNSGITYVFHGPATTHSRFQLVAGIDDGRPRSPYVDLCLF